MKNFLTLVVLMFAAAAFAGCQSTPVAAPLTEKQAADDGAAQMEFWHTLANRPITSNDEAFHAMLLFIDGKDSAPDYAHRVDFLKMRGILPASFNQPGEVAVRRGIFAVAIVKGLDIGGGVVMHALGPSPRYSLRELQYNGLFPESSENQSFSGSDFVAIIGRMEDLEKAAVTTNPAGQAAQTRRDVVAHFDDLRRAMLAQQEIAHWDIANVIAHPYGGSASGSPVLGFGPVTVAAADPAKPDAAPGDAAAAPAAGEGLKATVTGVQGLVQYRAKDGDAWQPVKVGLVLDQGAEFRTALRSVVMFTTPPGNTVKLDRLGTIKIVDAIKTDGKSKTNLGMKYGVSEVKVEAGGPEHETVIATPGSTLAIRGTTGWVSSGGRSFPDQIRVADGRGSLTTSNGKKYDMSGKGQDATTNTDVGSPGELSLTHAAFNPFLSGQAEAEQQLTNLYPSGTQQLRQAGITGGQLAVNTPPPSGGTQPPIELAGRLNFIVSWQGTVDIDSFVISPLNEGLTVFPSGGIPGFSGNIGPARTTPSGGAVDRDDTSANGIEQLFWNTNFPNGTYTYGGRYFGGSGPAVITIDVFKDNTRVAHTVSTINSPGDFTSHTINITGGTSNSPGLAARTIRAK